MNVPLRSKESRMGGPIPLRGESFRSSDFAQSIGRAALAHVRARVEKTSPSDFAARAWPNDNDVQLVLRAASPPLDLTSAAALAQIAFAVLPMLMPFSGAAQLFERGFTVTLGRAGFVTVPGIKASSGASLSSMQFVADGAYKPVIQGVTTGPQLGPHKIAGICVASEELYSLAVADTLLRALLSESSAPALDAVVFSNLAATAAHPAGIMNGITPVTAAVAGADAFITDIKALATAIGPVAGGGTIAYIASPGQVESVRHRMAVLDPRWIPSAAVPLGTIIAVATNAIVSALGVPEFETNMEATLRMDDAPTDLMSGPTQSLWQTASVGVKMVLPATWGVRSPTGVAFIQNANW